MRLDRDFLRELELAPLFELRERRAAALAPPPPPLAAAATEAVKVAAPHPSSTTKPVVLAKATTPAKAAPPALPPTQDDGERSLRIGGLDWAGLQAEAAGCQACVLCKQRKQAVLGVGAEEAPWLFVGEGPGADEDQQGEPFVGQAGKLLDAMLAAAGLQRGREVYIANVVKCRPPGNRTPMPEEVAACAPFLDRQIDLIQPKLIVALGKTAIIRLTGIDANMATLRGKRYRYRDIPVIATYHPAYLLRTLPDKVKAWEDLLLAKRVFAGD